MVEIGDKIECTTLMKFIDKSYKNAVQYLKDAKKILKSSPGHSFALSVLSLEELSKVFYFTPYTYGRLPFVVDKIHRDILMSHKGKHQIQEVESAGRCITNFVMSRYKKRNYPKDMMEDLEFLKKDKISSTLLKKTINVERRFYEGLQKKKERGMYVDIVEGKIICPNSISRLSAKKIIKHAEIKIIAAKRAIKNNKLLEKYLTQKEREKISHLLRKE